MPRGWWSACFALVLLSGNWLAGSPALGAPAEPAKAVKEAAAAKERQEDYELQRVLVDTLDQVQRNYVRDVNRRRLVEAAIKGILAELDPYSSYISPEEMDRFRTSVESEFGGIGIQVTTDQGQLKVLSPMVGTPAYRAGLAAGDHIVEIDGKPTGHISLDEAVRRLKGKVGTSVTLTFVHPGQKTRKTATIARQIIHIDTVLGDRRKPNDQWDFMLDPQKGIGYVRVAGFSRETAKELRRALQDLKQQKVRGLVLDLRFNPGGLLTSAIEVCGLFISDGRIVSTAGRNSPERVWNAHKGETFEGFPMVILVNHYSASASEIVSACLQDHKRAVVIGERTWGKGSVQNVIPLDDAAAGTETASSGRAGPRSALKLTTAGYRRPSGKNIDRAPGAKESDPWGVSPDTGFDITLGPSETQDLLADRHRRDVVLPKQTAASAGDAKPSLPPTKVASGSGPAKEPAKPSPPPAGAAKIGTPQPKLDAKTVTLPAANPTGESESPTPFVDRQLQKALDYLNTELARAK
jgi:carboxyl-terminal processing protease